MTAASLRVLWGWTAPARVLLALLAIAGGVGLFAVAPDDHGPLPDVPQLVVDPNTAPPQVLCALPKVGPAIARGIVSARQEAPFRSIDDLDTRVPRIGPATIEALRPHLRVGADASRTAAPPSPSPRMAQNANAH